MAIQRGIALSACPETTAGLTRSQGFQAGAQQRACACSVHSRGRATPGSVGEGVHYGQGRPEVLLPWTAKCLTLAARQMGNGNGDGDGDVRFALHGASASVGGGMARRVHDRRARVGMCLPGPAGGGLASS